MAAIPTLLASLKMKPTPRIRPIQRWMSVRPEQSGLPTQRKKVTIQHLHQLRKSGTPITMLTAYDFPTGRACETHNIDMTLVGDSLAQVCLGYDSTTRLTLEEMLHHCRAVARGSRSPFLLADMPFGTYHTSIEDAVRNATRLVSEGGMEAVKIEGGMEVLDVVRRLTNVGIPVMAHVGLMPQRHTMFSGYKVQGRDAATAISILESALALEEAGAFAILLEAIPHKLGAYITSQLRRAPTIGIGAGSQTNGQVLVWDDMLGTWSGHKAKFVRRFGDVRNEIERGVRSYAEEIRARTFPALQESYDMPGEEWDKFVELTEARRVAS
ncbi:ketopantoate hydroxymethyltransferase-domain-containing protein [Irpex rosettiformis]|uniref:Ketopantoate hydroxymethyltransferase-domain-containing protein n=1 Tax=Irpex rosettiformis TaxID=378272 RepID=A0ACB8U8C1_9APHY|nr:ketopantoate hydroxymethyltransferase-domain-containing protein [Irpex rosettiformis]